MAKKISDEVCLANYAKLCDLFNRVIPDAERFTVVYGCGVDMGMMGLMLIRSTAYSYSSYAIGFDPNATEIVVLQVDRELEHYGEPYYLKKSDIVKAKIGRFSKEIRIRASSLPQGFVTFTVQAVLNIDPDQLAVAVRQEKESKQFLNFFTNQYMK
ncbi:MAG: hypothetical protein LBN36_07880 [Clostridiales Family XIII bacterium]|nr:hypothetical protein [Clostridiales Family XIII bacterium]